MQSEILIDETRIRQRVLELASQIDNDYCDQTPILIGVLKGSFIFLSDLVRQMKIKHQVDFLTVASYDGGVASSGIVRMVSDLSVNIEGRHVLVVEDIIDTGLTTGYILKNLGTRNPTSLEFVVLLNKKECRKVDVPIKYSGFEIPDQFVIGYGLDYNQYYRNLPHIARL